MRATIGRPATGSTAEGVNGTRRLIGPSKSETYRKRPGPDDPLVTPRSGRSTGTRRKPPPPCGAAILPHWGGGRFCEFPVGARARRKPRRCPSWVGPGDAITCVAPRGVPVHLDQGRSRGLQAGQRRPQGGRNPSPIQAGTTYEHHGSAGVYDLSRHEPKFIEC